ncbi:MAG: DUF4367 domain-containing protein [Lachnospiraceae bacterium]
MERKKEADSIQSEDRKIELLLQEAFDYSDEQLLRELEMAEAQVKSAKMAEEETLDKTQELEPADKGENAAPSDEFEEILKKMRERGIEPKLEKELSAATSHPIIELDTHLRSAETSEPERPPEKEAEKANTETGTDNTDVEDTHKPRRFTRRAWGLLLAAAIAGALLWTTGIGVSGRKELEYRPNVRNGSNSDIAWNNESENYMDVDNEDEAYKVIEEKLGIPVLKIGYRPDGMKFSKLVLKESFAIIEFEFEGKRIHFFEGQGWNETSAAFSSDRKDSFEVENEWINQKVIVEENKQTDGKIEYSIKLEKDNTHYYLSGDLEKSEFEMVAADLTFN